MPKITPQMCSHEMKRVRCRTRVFDTASKSWLPGDDFDVLVNGTLSGPPREISDMPGRINIFAYNSQNHLVFKTLKSGESSDVVILADIPLVHT